MRPRTLLAALAVLAAGSCTPVLAEPAISFPANVTLETGDTWIWEGQRYRLFGVQSCLRGTAVTMNGQSVDCGNLSLARLGALFATNSVSCQPIGTARDGATFVVCAGDLSGSRIDLGTALISTGYAFAAFDGDGSVVNTAYLVAELTAKSDHQGLWALAFEHPVTTLLKGGQ